MTRALPTFVFCFAVWLAVTWSFGALDIGLGLVLSASIAWGLRNLQLDEAGLLLWPQRMLWALAYIPVLFVAVVRANLDVARRVLHPALPIRPGIVKVRTSLKNPSARVLLANSITLTPGTLSVDLVGDVLYVHRIHVPEEDPDGETERSLARFERYLRRVLE
jgi:multicomponent Na+:H+ antiporter subunit E